MKSTQSHRVAIMALATALAGTGTVARADDAGSRTNAWRVQVGWVRQWGRGMSVRDPSPAPQGGGRRPLSGTPGLTYPDNSAIVPREFDDGYVRPDIFTGDTDPSVPAERQDMTWNWGVDNASQYDYDGGVHPTLEFHIDRGETVGPVYAVSSGKSDDDISANGIEVKAKRLLYSWTRAGGETNQTSDEVLFDMSLVVGLAWFPQSKQTHRRATGQDIYGRSETYTYLDYYGTEAGGSWPALDVPYSGTPGEIGGPDAGPLIPMTPESSALSEVYLGTLRNSVEVKSRLWRLRGVAGVEFTKPLTERLSVYVAPQFVIEFVDMSVRRIETSSGSGASASRTDHTHKMSLYPGVLLTAGADYRLSENWYAGASLGYEWLFVDPSLRVGTDRVTFDLNGGEMSLYVGCRF